MAEGDKGAYFIGTSNVVLTGSINVTGANTDVPGTGTAFLSELAEGVDITVSSETRTIASVTNDTTATVTSAWGSDLADDLTPEVACQYATVVAAEAAIAATLVGNLTYLHKDEETALSAVVTFNIDTATYLLKLTAQSGAEHDGSAYGNGARINFVSYDRIEVDEASAGYMDNFEISKLALEISGAQNVGFRARNGGDSGELIADSLLIKGDVNSYEGIDMEENAQTRVSNCIVYDVTGDAGIEVKSAYGGGKTHKVLNNTVVKCSIGIHQIATAGNNTITIKNNLCQGNTTDYVDAGATFGTTAKNISEDATSPDDGIYDNLNCHDATSSFEDYVNDDYKLIAGGGTDGAIIDDGDDLSGTFTDDIVGTTRSTWWIGAFEAAAVAGTWPHNPLGHPLVGALGGPI